MLDIRSVGRPTGQCEIELTVSKDNAAGLIVFHETDLTMDTRQLSDEDSQPLKPVP
jgi:hypothetical protein